MNGTFGGFSFVDRLQVKSLNRTKSVSISNSSSKGGGREASKFESRRASAKIYKLEKPAGTKYSIKIDMRLTGGITSLSKGNVRARISVDSEFYLGRKFSKAANNNLRRFKKLSTIRYADFETDNISDKGLYRVIAVSPKILVGQYIPRRGLDGLSYIKGGILGLRGRREKTTLDAIRDGLVNLDKKLISPLANDNQRRIPLWSKTLHKSRAENAYSHWKKHRNDFPTLNNAREYVTFAQDFVTSPPNGTLKKIDGGRMLLYHKQSNVFAVVGADGAPKTIFKPKNGESYWNEQLGQRTN